MTILNTRRDILRGGLAAAGLGVLGIPDWALPALAQGETVVPFTDIPENIKWETPPDRRLLASGPSTGLHAGQCAPQQYGHPDVVGNFKLRSRLVIDRAVADYLRDDSPIFAGSRARATRPGAVLCCNQLEPAAAQNRADRPA